MSYRYVQELGQGGMARIFLAYAVGSSGFTKLVVLKMLRKQLAGDAAVRQMFQAEARLTARLNHPNLVQVYEVVEGDLPFLVMEYLEGKSLSAVRAGGPITAPMLLTIISEALIGLHHAHELCDFDGSPLNIVHRDVSPHNIFVTYDGAVKVLDFGIAKMATSDTHTDVGEIKGKIAYMAPEQLLGQDLDRRADIFSVGCILWEAAVGRRMWENLSEARLMHHLLTGNIPRPSERALIDSELETIIRKATAAVPDQRYATALELHRDLVAYLARAHAFCSMRDVGAALAEAFADERDKQKRALSSALRAPPTLLESPTPPHSTQVVQTASLAPAISLPPRKPWMTFAVPAAVIALAAVVLLQRSCATERTVANAVTRPEPAPVSIIVRATPPETTIEIDGENRGHPPLALRVPPEARDHTLRVSAPGYLPQARMLKFDRSQDVEIFLEKIATDPAAAAASTPRKVRAPRNGPATAPKGTADDACNPGYTSSTGSRRTGPSAFDFHDPAWGGNAT